MWKCKEWCYIQRTLGIWCGPLSQETKKSGKKIKLPTNRFNINIKKGDKKKLKCWQHSSLFCANYKILTNILGNKLKKTLPYIITEEQNCCIPGRTIFNNLFLTRDLIRYTKEKNIPLQIDHKKAFDKIDNIFIKP